MYLSLSQSGWMSNAPISVLQDIFVYLFSALAALKTMLNTIYNIQRRFLWQGNNEG